MEQLLTQKQLNSISAVIDSAIESVINTLAFKLAHRATVVEVYGEKCQNLVNQLLIDFVELKDRLLTDKSYRRELVLETGKYNVMTLQNIARFKGWPDFMVDKIPTYLSENHDRPGTDWEIRELSDLVMEENDKQNRILLEQRKRIAGEGFQEDCGLALSESVDVIISMIADDSFLSGDYECKKIDDGKIHDLCGELVDDIFDAYLGFKID